MNRVEQIAVLRIEIDNAGFVIADGVSKEIQKEIFDLGYSHFYFSPYDEKRGEPITQSVFAMPGTTYDDAYRWFYYTYLGKNPGPPIKIESSPNEIPETWLSVYKGVGGGRWLEIALVDEFSTAQALLNTMPCGKIKHGEEDIETKNSQLNDF